MAEDEDTPPRVFITHSSVDRTLAERIVKAVRLGVDVQRNRIFCSSIDGYGIDVGHDFLQQIHDQLQNTHLVVPLITPAYLDSLFCQWELGAAWVRGVDMFPILVDPVAPEQLQGPLQQRQVARLTKAGLNNLADRISASVSSQIERTVWEGERDGLLADLPEIFIDLKAAWAKTPAAEQRRAARLAAQATHLHQVFHRLRDAAALKVLHGSDNLDHFLSVFGYATDEIAQCFTGMTGKVCRVSVKQVIDQGNGEPAVVDLSRSGTTPVRKTPDPIEDNTDFKELMVGTRSYFLCNDITQLKAQGGYENSHTAEGRALPYNSTLVWPVRKTLDQPPQVGGLEAVSDWQDIIAYLCVDSLETDLFVESDIWVGAAIADAMYSVLRPWVFNEIEPE
jgi:hypothetical protein